MKKLVCILTTMVLALVVTCVAAEPRAAAIILCPACGGEAKLIEIRQATDDECDYRLVQVWHEEMQHYDWYEGISYFETKQCQSRHCEYEWTDRVERLVFFMCGDNG